MSYDEIAEVMDMNRNSVAQLISRARIKLRDELRGTALATIAASTEECERALPLIAMQDDRQLDEDSEDARVAGRARGRLRHLPRSAARRCRRPAPPTAHGRRSPPRPS